MFQLQKKKKREKILKFMKFSQICYGRNCCSTAFSRLKFFYANKLITGKKKFVNHLFLKMF